MSLIIRQIFFVLFFLTISLWDEVKGSPSVYTIRHQKFKIEKWDLIRSREVLARKIQRVFMRSDKKMLEETKLRLEKAVETSFLKLLKTLINSEELWLKSSGIQQRFSLRTEISDVRKLVLQREINFQTVVDRLPVIVRTIEPNLFMIDILKTLQTDLERESLNKQFTPGSLGSLGKVIDAMGKFSVKDLTGFLKEMQELMTVVGDIVDGFEDIDIDI